MTLSLVCNSFAQETLTLVFTWSFSGDRHMVSLGRVNRIDFAGDLGEVEVEGESTGEGNWNWGCLGYRNLVQ